MNISLNFGGKNMERKSIKLEELDRLSVYQCQCCKAKSKCHFKKPSDGLCPDHHYPLHYMGPLPSFYRSLGNDS